MHGSAPPQFRHGSMVPIPAAPTPLANPHDFPPAIAVPTANPPAEFEKQNIPPPADSISDPESPATASETNPPMPLAQFQPAPADQPAHQPTALAPRPITQKESSAKHSHQQNQTQSLLPWPSLCPTPVIQSWAQSADTAVAAAD